MGQMFNPARPPTPIAAPKPIDEGKAKLDAFRFADTERKLRSSTGRRSTFLTAPQVFTNPTTGM